MQQVLRFVGRVYTAQYVELGGTAHEGGGCDQSIGSTVSDAIVRSWLWSTATMSSPLGYFSILLQVVDNWPMENIFLHILVTALLFIVIYGKKGKVFYGQEPPS